MGPTQKWKRSWEDTSVNILKRNKTLGKLGALTVELEEIQETEQETVTIMEHVHELKEILKAAKFPMQSRHQRRMYRWKTWIPIF